MNKLFISIITILLLSSAAAGAYASKTKALEVADCKMGCGHESAPGAGTGQSVCWVTFIAADGYLDFKAQILSSAGQGLLRNAKGEIAIRDGSKARDGKKPNRISVDCNAIREGEKLVTCFIHEGKAVTRTIKGKKFKDFLPAGHRKGGIEVQL